MSALFDCHAHTADLSYCCDPDITPFSYVRALRGNPDLLGIALTNHGFATYFPKDLAWSAAYMLDPTLFDQYRDYGNGRLSHHLDQIEELRSRGLCTGLEVEMMCDGRLTLDDRFRARLEVIIGSVHFMPELDLKKLPADAVEAAWWAHTERLAGAGIHILGHPFRWLSLNAGVAASPELIDRVVGLAARHGIALEINGHMQMLSDTELLQACVRRGVKVAFGSDSHDLGEIGRLEYHRKLVADAGFALADVPRWAPTRRQA